MNTSEMYKELLKDYDKSANIAREKLAMKKQNCYIKCPRIKEIDEELNLTGIKISRLLINANKTDKFKYIDEIKNNTKKLNKEKARLLNEHGFSSKYFEEIYICHKCKDTGFIENNKCECFQQNLIKKYYNMYALSNVFEEQNFSTFTTKYYSDEICPENGMSPKENMKYISRKCSVFVEDFDTSFNNMVFFGLEGLGKTFLCNCIAKALLDKGKIVFYSTAFDLFDSLAKERFDENFKNNQISKLVFEADLLVLDDLGTEQINSISTTSLFKIINTRLIKKKSTIISTNLDSQKLSEFYTNRNLSRLYGEYDMIKFFGNDIRIEKKLNQY